jgi:two-component system, chemotaxis family, protein-glutamate methylesterase/glutaminase
MPDIDGITVLRELKRRRVRARAIMLSSLTSDGAQVTTDALLEGAFDFIQKPNGTDVAANREMLLAALIEKTEAFRASLSNRIRRRGLATPAIRPQDKSTARPPESSNPVTVAPMGFRCEAVAIATSTGGPVALRELLPGLPGDLPVPAFIVQHMPAQYTHSLAERLNQVSPMEVVEGVDGMAAEAGFAYVAPGGRHMKVERRAGKVRIRITDDPPEQSVRPAADYLFRSVAEAYQGQVLAVVMTGMGRDGTAGCREICKRGGYVIAQHADGCTVYGMPKAVIDEKLAHAVVPLDRLAEIVATWVRRGRE